MLPDIQPLEEKIIETLRELSKGLIKKISFDFETNDKNKNILSITAYTVGNNLMRIDIKTKG